MIILSQVKHNLSVACVSINMGGLACELSPLSFSSGGFDPLHDGLC